MPIKHHPGLDHLRAIAIILVFFFHYAGIFGHPEWMEQGFAFGWTGVDLFFVLSGFLISSQLFATIIAGKRISFPVFFIKRFFRIVPAYVVIVVLYFLVPSFREREGLAPLWRYLSFTQNIGLDLRVHGTFSHAWSLCIEEQFYLLLPPLLLLLVRIKKLSTGWMLLVLLFIGGLIIRWLTWERLDTSNDAFAIDWYQWIYYPTWCRLDGLVTGVAISAAWQFRPLLQQWMRRNGNYFLTGGFVLLAIAWYCCGEQYSLLASTAGFPLVALGYGCLLVAAINPNSFLSRPSIITSTIARLSYAIYLSHKMIIHITQEQLERFNIDPAGTAMLCCCIATCFAGALLLNILVEKPFLQLRARLIRKEFRVSTDIF